MTPILTFPGTGRERDVRPESGVSPLNTASAGLSNRVEALRGCPTLAELASAVTKLTAEVEQLRAQAAQTGRTVTGLVDLGELQVRKLGDVVRTIVEMRQHLMALTHRLRRLRRL